MQTHNFGATYQEGIVTDVDAAKHKVRCKIPALEDLETAWLPFLAPNAGGNQFYCLPDKGELVALLLDARGEGGCVLGAFYNEQDPTPVQDGEIWMKKFNNGTIISHHRKSGDVFVHTAGKVVISDCNVEVNSGTVTVNGGDVIADGISLKNHIHTEQGDGKPTSKPQ
ncbi:MAG: phage baseplate assembly protein V [[Actinobacillus] rossii]|nr:phage baseplate assembly protein V [[Actinobacillus] rossii]